LNSEHSVFTPFLRRFTDEAARDVEDTNALYATVRTAHQRSTWSDPESATYANNNLAQEIQKYCKVPENVAVRRALDTCQTAILKQQSTIFAMPEVRWNALSMKEMVDLRRFLRAKQYFLSNEDRVCQLLSVGLLKTFAGILDALPALPEEGDMTVPITAFMPRIAEVIDHIIFTLCEKEYVDAGLFRDVQQRLYDNVLIASGIQPGTDSSRQLKMPSDSDLPAQQLVRTYLRGTPFLDLFETPVPFSLPQHIRFQHQWIVAPPGAGKSNLLQGMIVNDLDLVLNDEGSVIVMESNRDLIKAFEGSHVFGPGGPLEGKLLSIDAEDVEWPLALNLFDVGMDQIRAAPPLAREALLNSVNTLYDYIFSSLLSAEFTSRQNTLFTFTLQLMLQIPGATLDTLIELMQPKGIDRFKEYLPQLDHDAQQYFQLKFNQNDVAKTKEQVLDRLFAVKRIRLLSRMLASPKSKIDFFAEMGKPQLILINLPQSLLQEEGVEIMGRFFIAMILLAAHKRQLLEKDARFPCFIYLDECQDFIKRDTKIPVILDQARKLNIGLVLSHQRLGQLQPAVLDALYGSTAIKFATNISDAGAHALARDMRTTPDFILEQPPYHFAAYARGLTNAGAVSIKIPLMDVQRGKRMPHRASEALRQSMRNTYCVHVDKLYVQPPDGRAQETPTTPAQALRHIINTEPSDTWGPTKR
jgi:hypothetical protein